MSEQIVTQQRITALCNIARWRGWTNRPFSVGEHTAIGAAVMLWFGRPDTHVKRWWMHDMHETEIVGDVPTPDKARYMNLDYETAIEEFDMRLGDQMGLGDFWWRDKAVKDFDRNMIIVENALIAMIGDPTLPAPDFKDPVQKMIRDLIIQKTFSDPSDVAKSFNRAAMRYGWGVL